MNSSCAGWVWLHRRWGPTCALTWASPCPTWALPEHHPVPPGHHPAPQHPSLCPIWSPCVTPSLLGAALPWWFQRVGKGWEKEPRHSREGARAGATPEPVLVSYLCPSSCKPAWKSLQGPLPCLGTLGGSPGVSWILLWVDFPAVTPSWCEK